MYLSGVVVTGSLPQNPSLRLGTTATVIILACLKAYTRLAVTSLDSHNISIQTRNDDNLLKHSGCNRYTSETLSRKQRLVTGSFADSSLTGRLLKFDRRELPCADKRPIPPVCQCELSTELSDAGVCLAHINFFSLRPA